MRVNLLFCFLLVNNYLHIVYYFTICKVPKKETEGKNVIGLFCVAIKLFVLKGFGKSVQMFPKIPSDH